MTDGRNGQVLLTGVTGYIAGHTLVALWKAGYRVRGSLRSMKRADQVQDVLVQAGGDPSLLEFVELDLLSDDGWEEAAQGCDYVVHMASPFLAVQPRDPQALIRPAVDGALRALKAARAAGVKRVAMTSSFAAVGYGLGDALPGVLTEETWSATDMVGDHRAYTLSKTLAEKAAWAYVAGEGQGLELAVLNPVGVLGPLYNTDLSTSHEIVLQPLANKMPAAPKMSMGIVDARDVAAAHVAALEVPEAAGERFLLCEEVMWLREVIDVLAEAYPDRKLPRGELPNWLVRLVAVFNPVLREIVPSLGVEKKISSQKARDVLGWQPISAKQSILDTAESLIRLGLA